MCACVYVYLLAESEKEMGVHHDFAIAYMPSDEPKALLSKASMQVEAGRMQEACAIYRDMYSALGGMAAT